MAERRFTTCLVLGGGAARALAHLGVLEEWEAAGGSVDRIVGTSMGAIVGALYALHGKASTVTRLLLDFVAADPFRTALQTAAEDPEPDPPRALFDRFIHYARKGFLYTRSLSRISLVPPEEYLRILSPLIPDRPMESLPIPFAAVATDVLRGQEVVLTRGSLLRAVQASAAIPGVLPPIPHRDRLLIDGGWIDNTPVAPARLLGAPFVLAVDPSWHLSELGPLPDSAVELAFRCGDITRMALNQLRRSQADYLLVPPVGEVRWSDFSRAAECVAAGRRVLRENLPGIAKRRLIRRIATGNGCFRPYRPPLESTEIAIL